MAVSDDVLCTKLWQPFEQTVGDISLHIWFEALFHWVLLLIPLWLVMMITLTCLTMETTEQVMMGGDHLHPLLHVLVVVWLFNSPAWHMSN